MRIDIFSDTICPWCYIGKKRFEKALAQRSDLALEIHWRAFQLNPDMPEEGMDRKHYVETKFGGPERARQVYARVASAGSEDDIAFNFEGIVRTPNTVASHRLIRYAGDQPGGQDAVVEALFEAYFIRGEDIGDLDVLVAAAEQASLDPQAVREFLASEEHLHAVRAEDVRARQLGIQGVPFFVIDDKYGISGAQPPDVFLQAFDQLTAEVEIDAAE
ncbi:MAG: DsbA family oxidoreductase [Gammaproteobacteria bacterium]|nr:DsbA family oxidoreductase [Gammaproteobacteria bacterium]